MGSCVGPGERWKEWREKGKGGFNAEEVSRIWCAAWRWRMCDRLVGELRF